MPSPNVISAGTIPLPIRISIPHPAQVLQFYDRIRVYRGAAITGPFVEITAVGTRIPIEANRTLYEFFDPAGVSTSYYTVDYFHTTNNTASAQSAPQPATGDAVLDILSVDELKSNFLFGLSFVDDNGNEPEDSFFEFYIRSAIDYLERRLDISIRQRTILDERLDYIRQDYERFIWLQLKNKPVISAEAVRLVLPTDQTVISYDPAWIQLDRDAGVVQIMPGSGGISAVALGLSALWAPLVAGLTNFMPDVFRVDYTCGFASGQVPYDIRELIGKLASMGPLAILGDLLFGPGIAGSSLSLDMLMTNTRTTKDGGFSAFGARLKQYRAEINEGIREVRRSMQGVRMVLG